ncbi:MAG: protease complex subunit PrcB family protein [Planctomycetota bacterium]|nr:protease complex subunit PrcB family protein [Planctomycetota bacterium]
MVKMIRRALAGFVLMSSKTDAPLPEIPHREDGVICRASGIRGFQDKSKTTQLYFLPGHEEPDVLRRLRSVVVENDRAPNALNYDQGMNVVVFRGVFGSGGYGLEVRSVRMNGRVVEIECDFEDPGDGIRTTAGFTQPTAIIPLKRLPPGKYQARLMARVLTRSSQGVSEKSPSREWSSMSFKITG